MRSFRSRASGPASPHRQEAHMQSDPLEPRTRQRVRRRLPIVLAAVCVAAGVTESASAVLSSRTGGAQVRVDKVTQTDPTTTSAPAWVDLPGAAVAETVGSDQPRLFDTSFSAESQCTGSSGGWCAVRIVATDVKTGQTLELEPAADTNFAFDSVDPGGDQDVYEAHAMERSLRLGAGTYRIRVQIGVVGANPINFR